MRHTTKILALFIACFSMSCTPTENMTAQQRIPGETEKEQLDNNFIKETMTIADTMEDDDFAQKTRVIEETKKELDDIQLELDRLAEKVNTSNAEAAADAKLRLNSVRENWTQAKRQLDLAENATELAWNDVKLGLQKSRNFLKESFEQTRQWLSDKIEP